MWCTLIIMVVSVLMTNAARPTLQNTGIPAGLFSDCPGILKNVTITTRMLKHLHVVIHQVTPEGIYRRRLTYPIAAKAVASDKNLDLKKRPTVMFFGGFLDSTAFPQTKAIATEYSKRGYNVLLLETLQFTTRIYPRAVRVSREVGKKAGEFLVALSELGLSPGTLELCGDSLGAHMAAFAAKYYFQTTGRKVARMTGLDPAGPCLRNLPPDERFSPMWAEKVDAIHTNIDSFGLAIQVGHIDIYVNGGEWQPSEIEAIPCLVLCSHMRAKVIWPLALEYPNKFLAMKCNSIQEARDANCYKASNESNVLGLETDFNKSGVFYLATNNVFPYYSGEDGLKEENEVYGMHLRDLNDDDEIILDDPSEPFYKKYVI